MKGAKHTTRAFFALLPDGQAREGIRYHLDQLSPDAGRKVRPDNIHLTLLFLGQIDRATPEALLAECTPINSPAFELTIDQAGWWPRAGVFWLGPSHSPPALLALVNQLNRVAGKQQLAKDRRRYVPHITLMRKVSEPPLSPLIKPFVWPATEFCLMQSITHPEGVEYRVLESWPLD